MSTAKMARCTMPFRKLAVIHGANAGDETEDGRHELDWAHRLRPAWADGE